MPQWEYREMTDPTTMEMTAAGDDRWECFAVAALHPRERGLLYTFKRPRQEASAAEPPLAALRRRVEMERDMAIEFRRRAEAEGFTLAYRDGQIAAYHAVLDEIDVLEGAQP